MVPANYLPPGTFDPSYYRHAISYGRFSKANQIAGISRERQEEALQDTLGRFKWKLLDRYFDPGISGGRGKHRVLGALGELIRQQPSFPARTILVIEAFDRLSREEITVAQEQFLHLVNRGLGVWTTSDHLGYDKSSLNGNPGQMFSSIGLMLGAASIYKVMSDRSLKGWQRRHGRKNAMCPGWLTFTRTTDADALVDGYYSVKKGADAILLRIFREAEFIGLDKLTVQLNTERVPVFRTWNHRNPNDVWREGTLYKIITGRTVRGERQIGRIVYRERTLLIDGETYRYEEAYRELTGQIVKPYPEIISEQQWVRTNAALTARKTYRGRKGKGFVNLFQGMTKCGHCGSAMRCKTPWLHCDRFRLGACANDTEFFNPLVEQEILAVFSGIGARLMARRSAEPAQPLYGQIATAKADIAELEQQARQTRRLVEQAAKQAGKSRGDIEGVLRLFGIDEQITQRRVRLVELERQLAQAQATPPTDKLMAEAQALIRQMPKLADADRYRLRAQLNTLFRHVIARIECGADGTVRIRFGENGEPYPDDPAGKWRYDYRIRFSFDDESVERDHPYLSSARLAHARWQRSRSRNQ
jgi:hypothetical protein